MLDFIFGYDTIKKVIDKGGKMEEKTEIARRIVEQIKDLLNKERKNPRSLIYKEARLIKDVTTDGKDIFFYMTFGPVIKRKIEEIIKLSQSPGQLLSCLFFLFQY